MKISKANMAEAERLADSCNSWVNAKLGKHYIAGKLADVLQSRDDRAAKLEEALRNTLLLLERTTEKPKNIFTSMDAVFCKEKSHRILSEYESEVKP